MTQLPITPLLSDIRAALETAPGLVLQAPPGAGKTTGVPLALLDAPWLARIEAAHQANPRDTRLQYLAGMACLKRQLWGKAQQLLTQAAHHLADASLRASAWRHLAELAERRGDDAAAAAAWKKAAMSL